MSTSRVTQALPADRLSRAQREAIAAELSDALLLSAHDARDTDELRAFVRAHFAADLRAARFVVPYREGALRNAMHERAQVVTERHTARGTEVELRASAEHLARWRAAGVDGRTR